MSRKNALTPLEDRMSEQQLTRREMRITRRAFERTVAQFIGIVGSATEPLRQGFWGRIRWIFQGN